jgi:hypothetical protein
VSSLRLIAALTLALSLPACGGGRCEVPTLIIEPETARAGDEVRIRTDGSLAPCKDRESGMTFRPLPQNTFGIDVVLVAGRPTPNDGVRQDGEPMLWGSAGYDEGVGTFEFTKPLPDGLPAGHYLVYLHQQPEAKGRLRVEPGASR